MVLMNTTLIIAATAVAVVASGGVIDPLSRGFDPRPLGPKPACGNCSYDLQFLKERTTTGLPCSLIGSENYQFGYCNRYACTNGYYYTFSGWSSNDCASHIGETTPVCPAGSCTP